MVGLFNKGYISLMPAARVMGKVFNTVSSFHHNTVCLHRSGLILFVYFDSKIISTITMHRLNPTSPIDPSFVYIAPSIHFRRAKAVAADSDSESMMNLQDPELILLFTWTGAQPHHIAKYTSGYTKLFPSSPIMVITTSIKDLLYRTSAKKQRSLIPAIVTILSSHLDSDFLVHSFSEGGVHKSVQFAKAFLRTTGRRLPVSALCLDSAPGNPQYTKMARACRKTAKGNPTVTVITSLLAFTVAASYWTAYPVISDDDREHSKRLFTKSRRELNNPGLWDVRAPRCYLFSNTDQIANPESVIKHARSAEKLSTEVFLVQFDNTDHCGHIKSPANADRYWAAVQRTWDAASGSTSSSNTQCAAAVDKKYPDSYSPGLAIEKEANMHVPICKLPSQHSPIDPAPEPILSASSSVYSSDDKETPAPKSPATAAPAPTPAPASTYKGPANVCIKKEKRKWYDCLRPAPCYQGWGGMGVDTDCYSYDVLTMTKQPGSWQNIYCYFYTGL
jgi:hypothetical protein